MRWWGRFLPLVLLMTLAVLLSASQNVQNLVQSSPGHNGEKPQPNSVATNAPAHANLPEAQETRSATDKYEHNAADKLTRCDFWSLLAQYLIFLATLIYAAVAIYQLWAIHRQADIAAEATIATRKSAEAAIESAEVAKLALRLGRPILVVKQIVQQQENWREQKSCSALMTVQNVGERPSVITKAQVGFVILDDDIFFEGLLPPIYDWGTECIIDQPVVSANADLSFQPMMGTWSLVTWQPKVTMEIYEAQFADVIAGKRFLAIYGIVYYRDAAMQNTGVEETYKTAFVWHFAFKGNWGKSGGYYVGAPEMQHST
jgi:hypothetical protein